MKSIYTIILLFFLLDCGQPYKAENNSSDSARVATPQKEMTPIHAVNQTDTMPKKPAVNPYEKANINVKTYQNNADDAVKGTWGYDIYIDKNPHPTIHQPSIPSVPGNNGFSTEAKALKAGEFVAYKIKHNIMPPRVDSLELDSIGVLH